MSRNTIFLFAAWLVFACGYHAAYAEQILFESATLGETGVTVNDFRVGSAAGINVNSGIFTGARFRLKTPVKTTRVGGHFVSTAQEDGTFFAAIVALDSGEDFPDSDDLSTTDVLGSTLINVPTTSAEVFGDLSLELQPGDYALIFGSGAFEAAGAGAAVLGGSSIGSPSFISFEPNFGFVDSSPLLDGLRLIVEGKTIPEPNTLLLMAVGGVLSMLYRGSV